jgi:hypothetical protein
VVRALIHVVVDLLGVGHQAREEEVVHVVAGGSNIKAHRLCRQKHSRTAQMSAEGATLMHEQCCGHQQQDGLYTDQTKDSNASYFIDSSLPSRQQ